MPERNDKPTPRGFTLIELLVVIGIIAVLVGILFPVVGKLRKSAYVATTAQSISTLQAAIQQYFGTFNTYPNLNPAGGNLAVGAIGVMPPTAPNSTEQLVLALQGGVSATLTATSPPAIATLTYNASDIGRGPVSLNPRQPKRYTPFGGVPTGEFGGSAVPEFQDAFPDALPILYLPALRSATAPMNQFDYTKLTGYGPLADTTSTQFASTTQFQKNTAANGAWSEYIGDPSTASGTAPAVTWSQPRQKDGYLLITAGPDRKFGSKDDQTNFGTPGE